MKNKKEIRDEIQGLSPFLWEQKGRQEGYEVPKDYFKSLPDEVFGKLKEQVSPQPAAREENWLEWMTHVLQHLFQPRYALAFATVAVLVVAGVYFTKPNDQPTTAVALLSELPDEALNEYVSENIDEFDEETLTELMADNIDPLSRLEIESSDELIDELIDDLSEEDLEDLL